MAAGDDVLEPGVDGAVGAVVDRDVPLVALQDRHLVVREVDVAHVLQRAVQVREALRLQLDGERVLVGHDAARPGHCRVHVDAEGVLGGGWVIEVLKITTNVNKFKLFVMTLLPYS